VEDARVEIHHYEGVIDRSESLFCVWDDLCTRCIHDEHILLLSSVVRTLREWDTIFLEPEREWTRLSFRIEELTIKDRDRFLTIDTSYVFDESPTAIERLIREKIIPTKFE
jgi:hypothetical protein